MKKNSEHLLLGQQMQHDPRIQQAKQVILETVDAYQQSIKGIKPPHALLKISYQEILTKFADFRGGKLYYPYIGSGFGKGALVELLDGSIKYDFISGIGVHLFGHSHLALMNSSLEAALSDTIMQGNLQQNLDTLELSELLIKTSKMDHCFLSSSGAMANENALKIAFQSKFPAQRILAFEHCFMGRTTTLSQITDKPAYREGLPQTIHVDYLPFFNHEQPEESIKHAVSVLKKHLHRHPKAYAMMSLELIQGEGGFNTGTKEFFEVIMTLLKDNNITVIVDEVQSFGRTNELFAFQHFQLERFVDIVTIGKLSQVCATLFRKELKPKAGLLSQTFTSSTSAIRAGKIIIETLMNDGYFGKEGKIEQCHQHFVQNLQKIEKDNPGLIRGPYGIGSMVAFTPYDGSTEKVTAFMHRLFDAGVIGFVAGDHPVRARFLMPVAAVTFEDIDTVSTLIEKVLKFES